MSYKKIPLTVSLSRIIFLILCAIVIDGERFDGHDYNNALKCRDNPVRSSYNFNDESDRRHQAAQDSYMKAEAELNWRIKNCRSYGSRSHPYTICRELLNMPNACRFLFSFIWGNKCLSAFSILLF